MSVIAKFTDAHQTVFNSASIGATTTLLEKRADKKREYTILISSIISISSIILSIKDDDGDDIVNGCVGREEVREAMLLLDKGSELLVLHTMSDSSTATTHRSGGGCHEC